MKKYKIITLLIALCHYDTGQNDSINLDKYWFYKERLKNFVYVSAAIDEAGTNIPAERISQDFNTLTWGDGNGAFNQYVSVLATECRLLKNYRQDYTQTINELYYALKSFECLDKTCSNKTIPFLWLIYQT